MEPCFLCNGNHAQGSSNLELIYFLVQAGDHVLLQQSGVPLCAHHIPQPELC